MMNKPMITVRYDRNSDVLYVTKVAGVPATSDEGAPGVLWRHSLTDGAVVGVTIMDFDYYWRERIDALVDSVADGLTVSRAEARHLMEEVQ